MLSQKISVKTLFQIRMNTAIQSQNEVENHDKNTILRSLVLESGDLFSPAEKQWHFEQIEAGETSEEKIKFYRWAAEQRAQILKNTPEDKKEAVAVSINNLLDQSSSGNREWKKGKPLREMRRAIEAFRDNQELVRDKTRRLKNLPKGLEKRIWNRFLERFDRETSGDILDPKLQENFRKSVETTFQYLAQVLETQEFLRKKIEKEKYFQLHKEGEKISEAERLGYQLEMRFLDWLNRHVSLKDWHQEFEDLVKKQTPKQLKEFKESYDSVFTPEFWSGAEKLNPMDFPNFTSAFNFTTESDFLSRFSLAKLKKFPKKLKKALMSDGGELLETFFSPSVRTQYKSKLKGLSEKEPAKIIDLLLEIKGVQEKQKQEAFRDLKRAKNLFLEKDPKAAEKEVALMKKKYGSEVLDFMLEHQFALTLELRMMQVSELEKRLKSTSDPTLRKSIQERLASLCDEAAQSCEYLKKEEREARIQMIESEVQKQRSAGDFYGSLSSAKKLRGLNDIRAELLISEIKREIEAREEDGNPDKKNEQNEDVGKKKKIEFLEKSIEHAQKVKEACDQVGIPKDDAAFWSPEGIKNRVKWLKDHGLYDMYQRFNSSDPNMPKDAQVGGFRFRWMDSRGDELNMGRAEQGLLYLQRYKESGYILAALAGAFSVAWKSASSPTYTPDRYITEVKEQLLKLRGA
jgi:hypothetical protein